MYHIYGMPRSRSTRVVWALEELGVDYQFHLVDLGKGEGQSPEFLKLNPSGKVPVLADGDLVLTESAAICTYLGDQHPQSELVPRPGTTERAEYDQWGYFVLTELEQPLWTIAKHKFALPKEKRVPAILEVAPWEFQRAAAVLAKRLEGRDYLLGNRFTMIDLLAAHTLVWARAFKVTHGFAGLDAYEQKICARAAFVRARERENSTN
ncbi:MAG TPA: glutathione S-transferase family protein [Malonomonas sp.]